jgi:beta-glucosidase
MTRRREAAMAEAAFHFPKGFRWGTATAAHQVEGNNTLNDWWAWEQQPGRILRGDRSGLACDWWGGRWKEDMDRAAAGGQTVHRFSVEWSRIEPEPGRWDESALDFYRGMLAGMRERGIAPMVTLHHFTTPLWLAEQGGWENEETISRFEAFTRKTVAALKDRSDFWCTINEPNIYAYCAYVEGAFPPGKKDIGTALRVMRNMVLGHAAAYHAIREIQPQARTGIAIHYRGMIPHTASPLDKMAARIQARLSNDMFPQALQDGRLRFPLGRGRIPEVAGTQDYLGLNYYSCDHVSFDARKPGELFARRFYPQGSDLSDVGWNANMPEGMEKAIRWADSFGLPIHVTENGIEDEADHIRPRYLIQHLHRIWKAVNTGSPVLSYYHWSLVDNFEWERGWTQRFGLWALDPATQRRTERASGRLYDEICKENGVTSDMVRRYAPEIFVKMFPG